MPEIAPPPLPLSASVAPVPRWRWWVHLLLIVPFPLVVGLLGSSRHDSHQAALTGSWQGLLKVSAVQVVLVGLPLGLGLWVSKTTRDDLMLRCRHFGRQVVWGVGYSVAIRLALMTFAATLCGLLVLTHMATLASLEAFAHANRPEVETLVDIHTLKHNPVYFLLTLTLVSFIVAGLREELWRSASLTALRKLWPGKFGTRAGEYVAVALTSILFGLGHLPQGVLAIGATALIGFALGSIMVFHRSTWLAVIAHGMFDAASFVMIALVIDKLPQMPG